MTVSEVIEAIYLLKKTWNWKNKIQRVKAFIETAMYTYGNNWDFPAPSIAFLINLVVYDLCLKKFFWI